MSSMFELQVDTRGTRLYAKRIVNILDPTGKYFGDRIVSRCDSRLEYKESNTWIHRSLQDDSMVVIVDDTEAMWPGAKNVIAIAPYVFWKEKGAEVNNAAGHGTDVPSIPNIKIENDNPTLSGNKRPRIDQNESTQLNETKNNEFLSDEELHALFAEPPHDYLEDVARVLKSIHSQYYSEFDSLKTATANGLMESELPPSPNTSQILSSYMKSVLHGCCIAFSGVFPLHVDPRKDWLFKKSLKFGACIVESADSTSIDLPSGTNIKTVELPYGPKSVTASDLITHLASRFCGTAKVLDAINRPGVRIVSYSWLLESLYRYKREEENQYPLDDAHKEYVQHNLNSSRELTVCAFLDQIVSDSSSKEVVQKIDINSLNELDFRTSNSNENKNYAEDLEENDEIDGNESISDGESVSVHLDDAAWGDDDDDDNEET
jgi:RNA polymerase II subunit A C-terminal domain phosphatase